MTPPSSGLDEFSASSSFRASDILRTFIELYVRVMHAPSGLTRTEREMVATIVSRVNECHY